MTELEKINSIEKEPNNLKELVWVLRRTMLTIRQIKDLAQLPNTRRAEDLLIYLGLNYPLYEDGRFYKILTQEEIDAENERQTAATRKKLLDAGLEV